MENKNSLAEIKSKLPTLPNGTGLGFDCLDSSDLVASRIAISQPSSQTEVEQGNFYDTNDDKNLGKEIKFFVFSKRTSTFMGKDMTTNADKIIEKKEILVMPEVIDFPFIISLSVTGYWPLSNLLTKLFKGYGKKGYPIFTGLIKATTELIIGDKGKYYIPKFDFVRVATKEEMNQLLSAYQELVPLFRQSAMDASTPTKAPFEEPKVGVEYPDKIAEGIGLTQEEIMAEADKIGQVSGSTASGDTFANIEI